MGGKKDICDLREPNTVLCQTSVVVVMVIVAGVMVAVIFMVVVRGKEGVLG